MHTLINAAAIYLFLLIVFRVAGHRTLAEVTTFDLVLILIISECVQGALIDTDSSLTNAALTVLTLVGLDIFLSLLKDHSAAAERVLDGVPALLLATGTPIRESMRYSRVDEADILSAARLRHGLTRLDEIQYAVLECGGGISIIPRSEISGTDPLQTRPATD